MKKYIVFVMVLCIGCKTQFGIINTVVSESGQSIVSHNADGITITVEPFTDDTWFRIAENSQFIDKANIVRLPKLFFFLILIENKTETPAMIKDIVLRYDNTTTAALTTEELQLSLSSPAYEWIKVDELTVPRRLLYFNGTIQNIDFAHDTIPCTLPFVPAGDSHINIIAFTWIPVNVRKFTIVVTAITPGSKKIVECNFIRNEYRTRGKHFLQ
ncbi:MAG: hypothetical protein KBG92_01925 [Spirochaetes bacterium]|nr:hypothetical protein [Spirochaetota bacterium]